MEETYLKILAGDTLPFSLELAAHVADCLEDGRSLGYSHRDYCGMGLEYRDGKYYYGALWDGAFDLDQPVVYPSRTAFISWLAEQSTATMARIDDKDPFYRGNQVITRQRLREFLEERSGSFD